MDIIAFLNFPPAIAAESFNLNFLIIAILICWGIWGILDKKALKGVGSLEVLVRLYSAAAIQVPLGLWWISISSPHEHAIPSAVWSWTCLAAVCQLISLSSYLQAMTMTEASYVLGITAAYPVVLQLLAIPFLGENLVFNRIVGAVIIALGVALIGSSPQNTQKLGSAPNTKALTILVVLATLGWGLWSIVEKKALIAANQPLEVFVAERAWDTVMLFVIAAACYLKRQNLNWQDKSSWKFALLSALALTLGRCMFLNALSVSSASYVITITGCYPLLMYLFALILLKEKFSRLRCFGIVLVVAGGILVQLTQSL